MTFQCQYQNISGELIQQVDTSDELVVLYYSDKVKSNLIILSSFFLCCRLIMQQSLNLISGLNFYHYLQLFDSIIEN